MQVNLTLGEIKKITGALVEISADAPIEYDSFLIKNISSLENSGTQDIAILMDRGESSVFDNVSIEKIKNSKAGFILSKEVICLEKKYLLVDDPIKAFSNLVDFLNKKDLQKNCADLIDDSAFVSETAKIAQGVIIQQNSVILDGTIIEGDSFIGAQCFVGKNVFIGSNVKIYPGVKILDNCVIGNNTIIHSGTVIGSDGFGYSVTKMGLKKIPQIGIVKIGNDVEIGANCSIDRAAFDQTVIGNGVKIDNMVHVAHNVVIGDHTVILAQTGIAGGAIIGFGCQIGGQVAIKDHIKIGNGAKIVSKSGVMKDIESNQVVCGIPAIQFNQWKRISVVLNKLPEYFKTLAKIQNFIEKKESKKSFWSRFF
ncbi:UDP-3-O-(3-hydroxymyristoyl)glucosamine N-acyltransferase [Candidatus Babeliales bacterium]|nr:UDP-3-O-(3-hydroxymyristoyl)glucosamine N-acyltransferase [Candidatus Babeliales bacterium]